MKIYPLDQDQPRSNPKERFPAAAVQPLSHPRSLPHNIHSHPNNPHAACTTTPCTHYDFTQSPCHVAPSPTAPAPTTLIRAFPSSPSKPLTVPAPPQSNPRASGYYLLLSRESILSLSSCSPRRSLFTRVHLLLFSSLDASSFEILRPLHRFPI